MTGGSGGIGAAIAHALAQAGAQVLVAGRNVERAEGVASAIVAAGGAAWPLELDVSRGDSVAAGVVRAAELAERVDWLINNAGIAVSAPLLGGADDGDLYRTHLEVNFHGPRRLVEALLPGMREREYGRIVNVASSAGLRGYAYVAAYCASKHALLGYTRAAALELKRTGVAIAAVCPHYVDSPMLDQSIERLVAKTGRSEQESRDFFRQQNPGGALVDVQQVAAACVALCTEDRNGALLELDGSSEAKEIR